MKKLTLLLSDEFGFRSFIPSDFLVEAEKSFDAVLFCLSYF